MGALDDVKVRLRRLKARGCSCVDGDDMCVACQADEMLDSVNTFEQRLEEVEADNERMSDAAEQLAEVLRHRRKNAGHFCPDWDYMYIERGDPEYDACTCPEEA